MVVTTMRYPISVVSLLLSLLLLLLTMMIKRSDSFSTTSLALSRRTAASPPTDKKNASASSSRCWSSKNNSNNNNNDYDNSSNNNEWASRGVASLLRPAPPSSKQDRHHHTNQQQPTKLISLMESIQISRRSLRDPDVKAIRRQYWKKTFAEIRNIAADMTPSYVDGHDDFYHEFMNRWKLFLLDDDPNFETLLSLPPASWSTDQGFLLPVLDDSKEDKKTMMTTKENVTETTTATADNIPEDDDADLMLSSSSSSRPWRMGSIRRPQFRNIKPPRRFEGFASWERMLQDWTEDVQEYLDKVAAINAELSKETTDGLPYSMSNYGRPLPTTTTIKDNDVDEEEEAVESLTRPFTRVEGVGYNDTTVDTTVSSSTTTSTTTVINGGAKQGLLTADSPRRTDDHDEQITTTSSNRPLLPIPAPAHYGEDVVPHTNIADKSKRILVVTTASLPWKTGTAVNPLLRAAYLTHGRKIAGGSVTLMLPWLERAVDQENVYGVGKGYATPEQQEEYIRSWLHNEANLTDASIDLNIQWYTAWQNKVENSLYSMGDITALINASDVDICILEEPEHLNWYRAPGEHWTTKFQHVVGILHTNYFAYAIDQPAALVRAPAMRLLCSWMCRAHCHRVIKLSGTLDPVAPEKELVENVHGIRETFLDVGRTLRDTKLTSKKQKMRSSSSTMGFAAGLLDQQEVVPVDDPIFGANAEPTVYFIGKMLWSKGLGSLMELLKYAEESAGLRVKVDMYGGGPDAKAAELKAERLHIQMPFHGPLDHSEVAYSHKIFVNPSTSEVLCTTSAEALGMGKFVILPSHPSNDFFAQFPNCLPYTSKEEFVGNLYYALTHEPEPLSDEYAYALSWEAATERLEAAGCIPVHEAQLLEEATASEDAGTEIPLPTLVDNEKSRKALSATLRSTRNRYRQLRSRLSTELSQTRVLPKTLRGRLVQELDKRLDLDFEDFLESPKLRLKLSPAEVDKTLLDLYDKLQEGPSGDVLRVIGGGGPVALQHLYMKRHAMRERRRRIRRRRDLQQRGGIKMMKRRWLLLGPNQNRVYVDDDHGDDDEAVEFSMDDGDVHEHDDDENGIGGLSWGGGNRTATQWVRWAMRRNIPNMMRQETTKNTGALEISEDANVDDDIGEGRPPSGGNRTAAQWVRWPMRRNGYSLKQHVQPHGQPQKRRSGQAAEEVVESGTATATSRKRSGVVGNPLKLLPILSKTTSTSGPYAWKLGVGRTTTMVSNDDPSKNKRISSRRISPFRF